MWFAGFTALVALASCLYTVPWHCGGRRRAGGDATDGGKSAAGAAAGAARDFNVLWHGRVILSLLCAAWAVSCRVWSYNVLLCCVPNTPRQKGAELVTAPPNPCCPPPCHPQLSLLLRVSSLWGANSFVLPAGVRAWTGAGWMCRIFLTAGLGVLHPLCACLTLLMLKAALR